MNIFEHIVLTLCVLGLFATQYAVWELHKKLNELDQWKADHLSSASANKARNAAREWIARRSIS